MSAWVHGELRTTVAPFVGAGSDGLRRPSSRARLLRQILTLNNPWPPSRGAGWE